MPVTKSAKKKLRQDKKRTIVRATLKDHLKAQLKKTRKTPTPEMIVASIKATDKAAKKNIIHKNKAARIKSSLSKLMPTGATKTTKLTAAPKKKTTTKKATK